MSFSTTPASGSSTASTVVITPGERHDQTASSHSASSSDGRGKGKQRADSSVQWYTASESEGEDGVRYGGRQPPRVGWTRGVDESDESDYTPAHQHRPQSLARPRTSRPKIRRGSSSIATTPSSFTFSDPHDVPHDPSIPYIPRSPRKRRKTSIRDSPEPMYEDELPQTSLPRRPGKRRIMAFVEIPYDEALARRIADGAYAEWSDILEMREEARASSSQSAIASSLGEERRVEAGVEAAWEPSLPEAARASSTPSGAASSFGEESREEAEVEAAIIVDEEGEDGDADAEEEEEDEPMFSAEESLGDAAPALEEDIWPPAAGSNSPMRPEPMVVVEELREESRKGPSPELGEALDEEVRKEVREEVRQEVRLPGVEDTEDELSPLPEDRVYEEPEEPEDSEDSDYFEIVGTRAALPRPKKPASKLRRTPKADVSSRVEVVLGQRVKVGANVAEVQDDEESLQDLVVAVPWLPPERQEGSGAIHAQTEVPSHSPIHEEQSCHQCHRMSSEPKMSCSNKPKNRRCPFFFCKQCCKHYSYFTFEPKSRSFVCPRCKDICECDICIRRREIFKSGGLKPFAMAPYNAVAGPSSQTAMWRGPIREAVGMPVLPRVVADLPGLPSRPMLGPRLSLSSAYEQPVVPEKSGWKGKGKGALRPARRQSEPKASTTKRTYPPIMLRLRMPKSANTPASSIRRVKELDSDGDTVGDYSSDEEKGRHRGRSVAASSVTSRGNSRSPLPSASRPLGGMQVSPTRRRTLSTNEYLSSLAPLGLMAGPEEDEETEKVYSPFSLAAAASAEASGLKVGSGTVVPTISVETPATPEGTVVPPLSAETPATPDENPDWPSFVDPSSSPAAPRSSTEAQMAPLSANASGTFPVLRSTSALSSPPSPTSGTSPPIQPDRRVRFDEAASDLGPSSPVAPDFGHLLSSLVVGMRRVSPPAIPGHNAFTPLDASLLPVDATPAASSASPPTQPDRRVRFDEAAPAVIPSSPVAAGITHLLPSLVVEVRTVSPPAETLGNDALTPMDLTTPATDQPAAGPSRSSVSPPHPPPKKAKKAARSKSPKRAKLREAPPPPVSPARLASSHLRGHVPNPHFTVVPSAAPAQLPKPMQAAQPAPSAPRAPEAGTRTWPLFPSSISQLPPEGRAGLVTSQNTTYPPPSSLSMAPPPFRPIPLSALPSPRTNTFRHSFSSLSQSRPSSANGLSLTGDYPAWSTAPPPYSFSPTLPSPSSHTTNPYSPLFGSTPAPPKARPSMTPVPLAPLYTHFTPTLLGSTGINYQQHTSNQHFSHTSRYDHYESTAYPPTPSSASTVEGKTALGLEIALAQMRSRGWTSTNSGYFR